MAIAVLFITKLKSDEKPLSDITLANLEALGWDENDDNTKCTVLEYKKIWSGGCLYECAVCAEGYYLAIAVIDCVAR